MTQTIFFAHANGFPSATYGKLFDVLQPDYRVRHLEMHGHDPRFPVNANWGNLVDELLHHLARLDEPVWGVGHSLGGILHYHAALRRPELYRGVVMLDSPVFSRPGLLMIRAAKHLGLIDRLTPAGRTLGRREEFADLDEARSYFAGKTLFRRFDPDCLEAYLQHGLAPTLDSQGLRLRFDPATEISIYRNIPHTSPGRPGQLAVPLTMVLGEQSRVLPRQVRWAAPARHGECLYLPGGHMFPLERPRDTAELLKDVLGRWQQRIYRERASA
ncbi:Alpha/beta hydrolase family protein [compost metagenome]